MGSVLFVDDERRVLDGLENLLFEYSDDWDMDFCESGEEALDRLGERAYDVLVTDMRMPGMDGSMLLRRVQQEHPGVARIVLSGHSEVEAALRAMPVAHQFLSKPCEASALCDLLERAHRIQGLISDPKVRDAVGGVESLPVRPAVYSKLTELLSNDGWSLGDVTKIVSHDIGIAMKLVQIANTAFFSRGQPVKDVAQAVPRLGVRFVRDIILGFEVYRELGHEAPTAIKVDALHENGLMVGALARKIATDRSCVEEAFLGGLLHDVGQLLMATRMPAEYELVQARIEEGATRSEAEAAELGFTHADLGAYLVGLWGLPYRVLEAIAYHHAPRVAVGDGFGVTGPVHVATCLIDAALGTNEATSIDEGFLQQCNVVDQVDRWRELAEQIARGDVD